MLRMDQVHVIRHKVLVEGQSRRAVARQLGVSRNTVRKYLEVSAPVRRESRARARPVLEAVTARMEALLEQWSLRSTAKQRVTGSRLHQELVEEGSSSRLSPGASVRRAGRSKQPSLAPFSFETSGTSSRQRAQCARDTHRRADPRLLVRPHEPKDCELPAGIQISEKAKERWSSDCRPAPVNC